MTGWLVAAALAFAAPLAAAQAFPDRPVRIVVPLPPGGSPDTIARVLSQNLQGLWSQPVIVENRTGGSQNIGADAVAKSSPDGYTWFLSPDNVFTVNPHLGKQSFDPFTDLAPVTLLARIQFLLVVNPDVPAKSVPELVAYARANPNALNFGSSGTGSPQFLGGMLLQQLTGTKMNHVPYKGAAPAVADLLPNRIQVWIGAANSLLPHIRDGRLRLLATAADRRFGQMPDTPTIAEAGVPGYALYPWLGMFVPGKTPPEIVAKINADMTRILTLPDMKERETTLGYRFVGGSPEKLAGMLKHEIDKWAEVANSSSLK